MDEEQDHFYQAFAAKDARFDGIFFVGVTSTGIYCRPICTARMPKKANLRFFKSREAAEKEFFRPCLRCRPELSPGNAPIDSAHRIANQLTERVDQGDFDEAEGLEGIAKQFSLSSRQIRRIVQNAFGVSPLELILTRRLLLAKQLLTETNLSITEIAFASGFSSLRRFNDAFKKRYRMPPSHLRKAGSMTGSSDSLTLQLNYRPPYDWQGILGFLSLRLLKGVEHVEGDCYLRTVQMGQHTGWLKVSHAAQKNALKVEMSLSLTPVLGALLGKVRNLFDLTARPDTIATRLSQDPLLEESVLNNPGLRVPGAFDGFELSVRAILGQQITVSAATKIGGRFVQALAKPIVTPFPQLYALSPTADSIAKLKIEEIASQGIIRTRARSILCLAEEISAGRLKLDTSADPDAAMQQLTAIPGIGQWTAHYIAMRALRWPDAFPKEDVALRKKLGGVTAKQAEALSQPWRPWRSYALLHLWRL